MNTYDIKVNMEFNDNISRVLRHSLPFLLILPPLSPIPPPSSNYTYCINTILTVITSIIK